MPSCVVTGASSGIGEAIATDLIRHGWRVFGTIRSEADAERLESTLGGQFTAVPADVTDTVSLAEAAADVAEALKGEPLAGLVCNSGISLPGPLLYQPLEELDRMWSVNVRGIIATVQAFAPLLGARPNHHGARGRVITISSVSGKVTYPFVGGYSASKHAVEAISDALRVELIPFGVDLITVAPGPIKTPLWKKAGAIDRNRYEQSLYGPMIRRMDRAVAQRLEEALPPQEVASAVYKALSLPKPRPRYTVTGKMMTSWVLPRLMPRRLVDKAIARELHLKAPGS